MKFKLISKDTKSQARTGCITTDSGTIETPVFMPVGTVGSVKNVTQRDLQNDIKAKIILGNTYHLFLRPGVDIIKKAGGLHKFISWPFPMLTDSGGYQVFSLSNKRKIDKNGVVFFSHIDGSAHLFTPEKVIDIQRILGADIIMAFDECPPSDATYSYVRNSLELTHRWTDRCKIQFENTTPLYNRTQTLFAIIQGGVYKDLREKAVRFCTSLDFDGYAIGGLSVGEPKEKMYEMLEVVNPLLPENKPRYLMGVGTPENLLESISRGIDMFDCVLPTRNARHGLLYTSEGMINIKNRKWTNDLSPLDMHGTSYVDTTYSKSYVRHLISSNELLGIQICSVHNLAFYISLMKLAREYILNNNFENWKNHMLKKLNRRL